MFAPHMAGETRRLEETLVAHHAEVGSLVAVLLLVEDDGVPIRKPETIRHDEIFMSSVLDTFERSHLTKPGIKSS